MKRLKWLRAESKVSMRELAKRLQNASFVEGAESGFLLDRARDNYVDARWVERTEFVETFIDPFGNSQAVNRVLYKQIDFRLTKDLPQLELRTPPRGLSVFFNALMKTSNFSMSIESYDVDLVRWTKVIDKTLGTKPSIKGAIAGRLLAHSRTQPKRLLRERPDG